MDERNDNNIENPNPGQDEQQQQINPEPPAEQPPVEGSLSNDEKTWSMLCHLSAIAGYVIPFGNIIGPLVIWLVKKDQMPSVDTHGKESLNFQITITIYMIISIILMTICIGFFLAPAVGVFCLVMIIIASVKANQGELFRYPLCIRFIK